MKLKSFGSVVAAAIAIGASAVMPQPTQAQTGRQFLCGMSDGSPATLVRTVRGNLTLIRWTSNDFTASGWTPERRCKEISSRFERLNSNGQLKYLLTGKVNGQSVICGSTTRNSGCSKDTVLVTIKPGSDSIQILQRLLSSRSGAAAGNQPLELTGEEYTTVKPTIEQDGSASVDMDALIEQKNW